MVLYQMQEEGYLEALKCDGTDLDGQQLRVQKCMSAGAHVPKKKQMAATPEAVASPAQQQQPAAPKVSNVCLPACPTLCSFLHQLVLVRAKTAVCFLVCQVTT